MREGFHAHGGWYFRRGDDGSVTIEVAESSQVDAPLLVGASFDPDTWASIVASVSRLGETAGTWDAARLMHGGEPRDAARRMGEQVAATLRPYVQRIAGQTGA